MDKRKNLEELLNTYKVADLKEVAKIAGIKGYSKLKKAELVELLTEQLPSVAASDKEGLPEEIVEIFTSTSAGEVAVEKSDSKQTASTENTATPKRKSQIFGVAPHIANVLSPDVMPYMSQPNMIPTTKKIFPNDTCPCGSGKKYKKCCGRR